MSAPQPLQHRVPHAQLNATMGVPVPKRGGVSPSPPETPPTPSCCPGVPTLPVSPGSAQPHCPTQPSHLPQDTPQRPGMEPDPRRGTSRQLMGSEGSAGGGVGDGAAQPGGMRGSGDK